MLNKKTIIVCPYFETGGPEALHQLCDAINNKGEMLIYGIMEKITLLLIPLMLTII
jgi:hypothetical protein